MSYNEELQSNNNELAEILRTVNALPEAGGGGSSGGLSVVADETFTLAMDLLSPGNSADIFQSDKIANQNWYCIIIKKLNPVLAADTYEGVALYRLNGFNANMIRWNKTAYSSAHYHTYLNVSDDGIVKLVNQGATLPWLAGEYRITIVG